MNKVVEVLMRRDGMSEEDAADLLKQTREEINEVVDDYEAVEDIIASNLGLEMDYIFDILG